MWFIRRWCTRSDFCFDGLSMNRVRRFFVLLLGQNRFFGLLDGFFPGEFALPVFCVRTSVHF